MFAYTEGDTIFILSSKTDAVFIRLYIDGASMYCLWYLLE